MKKRIKHYERSWLDHRASSRTGANDEKSIHSKTDCGDSPHYARLLGNRSRSILESPSFLCMETDQCNTQAFLQFLQYTLSQYPDQHVVMVLDNAKFHLTKILQPFLLENEEQLTPVFLPSYSSNLNLVEQI